jgi:DNA-binding transcriptional MerR regulator
MDELVERVQRALAEEYPGAPNGRVRDVPDRRAIRWYTTTGLVDRPAGLRGRTALYGPRHLLQIVALKRRQAQGRSLAEIQAELGGAPDERLAEVARVPDDLLAVDGPAPDPYESAVQARFWAVTPAADPDPLGGRVPVRSTADVPRRFDSPADPVHAPNPAGPARSAVAVGGVALPGGAILVVPGTPTAADRAAIAAAAGPLLDLLAQRGLLTTQPLDDRRTP